MTTRALVVLDGDLDGIINGLHRQDVFRISPSASDVKNLEHSASNDRKGERENLGGNDGGNSRAGEGADARPGGVPNGLGVASGLDVIDDLNASSSSLEQRSELVGPPDALRLPLGSSLPFIACWVGKGVGRLARAGVELVLDSFSSVQSNDELLEHAMGDDGSGFHVGANPCDHTDDWDLGVGLLDGVLDADSILNEDDGGLPLLGELGLEEGGEDAGSGEEVGNALERRDLKEGEGEISSRFIIAKLPSDIRCTCRTCRWPLLRSSPACTASIPRSHQTSRFRW